LSADDFFEKHGKYKYDPARIGDAHAQAKQRGCLLEFFKAY